MFVRARSFVAAACAVAVLGWLGAARAADAPIVIPSIASLTGFASFLGKAQADTLHRFETAINKQGGIKGRPIHFEVYDDQSNPQIAVQLINEIMSKKANVVIGPSVTNQCAAILPLVQGKIVQYCISPGVHAAPNSFTFAASVATADVIRALTRYFHAQGWNRIATLTTTDVAGQQADQSIAEAVGLPENSGAQIVDQEHFTATDVTVAAQIAKIKAASPQVLFAWVIGTPFGTALRGIADAGYDIPVGASNADMTLDQMKQWGPYLPTQLFFPGVPFLAGMTPTRSKAALQLFYSVTKDTGLNPDFQTGIAWDPALILTSTLRELGPDASPDQIRDYIEKLHDFAGISGLYDFRDGNQRGLSQKDVVVMRWDAAKNNWVGVSKPGGAAR
jgi:ABC-type branched-subunit amino acid transport system substrate-binding protein